MRILRFLTVFLVLSVMPVAAQTVPHLVLPQIDGLIEADGSGAYQKVLAAAAQGAGLSYTAEVFPRARALAAFLERKYDGIFTFTKTARDKFGAPAIVAGYPLGAYRGYVFRARGTAPVTDFSQLLGKDVGGVIGFEGTYDRVTQAGALVQLVTADELNFKKLRAGRIDAVLAFLPDVFPLLEGLSYDPALPFFESFDRLTLFNTPAHRVWLEKLSAELQRLHENGTVRALVGPAYLPIRGTFALDR